MADDLTPSEEHRAYVRRVLDEIIARGRAAELERLALTPERILFAPTPHVPSFPNPEPEIWRKVTIEGLRSWIEERMRGAHPLPIFKLAESGARPDERHPAFAGLDEFSLTQRSDSGIWEMQSRPDARMALAAGPGRFFERLFEVTRGLDERDFKHTSVESSVIRYELRSMLPIGLPAIGPGGRVTVYAGHERLSADIVVRRRVEQMASEWIDPAEIQGRVAEKLSQYADVSLPDPLYAAFGYFELSKYERQSVMRPAFAFLFESTMSEAAPMQWRVGFAHPATHNPGLARHEGIGLWAD